MQVPDTYEAAVIYRPDLEDEKVNAAIERLTQMIKDGGGTPGEPDRWGKRHLAYEIGEARDGIYLILPFTAPPGVPATLERAMRISEDVLRFMVVHPPVPSPGRRVAAEGPGDAATAGHGGPLQPASGRHAQPPLPETRQGASAPRAAASQPAAPAADAEAPASAPETPAEESPAPEPETAPVAPQGE